MNEREKKAPRFASVFPALRKSNLDEIQAGATPAATASTERKEVAVVRASVFWLIRSQKMPEVRIFAGGTRQAGFQIEICRIKFVNVETHVET